MKILVSVKRVPDPESKIKINADGSDIVTEGLSYVVNPFDEIAVEEAIRLKTAHKGEIVIVSIGTKDAVKEIRTAMAMGADRGILVQVDQLPDPEGAARILKAVVDEEKPDVVLMGKQAIDDDANQAGQLLAEFLGWPQVTFASKEESLESADEKAKKPGLKVNGQAMSVVREIDGGLETVEAALPAVITVDLRLNVPRYASLPGIMKAKKKPLKQTALSDLGVEVTPKITLLGMEAPPERQAGIVVETVQELVEKLQQEAKVI